MLQARENLMEAIQAFLKKYDQIPPKETSIALLLAEERFLKIKQTLEEEHSQPENIQELLLKLNKDLQILNKIQLKQEEQAAKETESNEVIKSSVENFVPIPSESEDTSESDSDCNLSLCNDFSLINVFEEKSVTFSNPLLNSNDDCTSSDDESLSDVDVSEDKVKIYSNPIFEFDDEYISSDVNPLFNEVLENTESKESYVSNLDETALLVTPLSDANEDEFFDLGGVIDEIDAFLDMDISTDIKNGYHDSEVDIIYLESLLIDDTIPNLPPRVFLDHDPRSLKDEPDNDDLMTKDKVFDLGIWEIIFSSTYVKLTFEDRHYLSLKFVI
ncbi:hypothetical protein Tco_0977955 [Tanacetum coccineum]|uniref:Uncharacterized protein n=1 Tax=Tanacetum coccineum TaxID=301880 RepID=A0ABQ5ELK1_9ASTR